jgi:molybdopterin molybdotransferase
VPEFFRVKSREQVLELIGGFGALGEEEIPLGEGLDRVLSRGLTAPEDLPPFPRATMDGFAVRSRDTFGASEGLPALLRVLGEVPMGAGPTLAIGPGEAVRIATGGMLPAGADAVVMVEHTASPDPATVELYGAVAPGENAVAAGEDVPRGRELLPPGWTLRPQDLGLLAALGVHTLHVHRRPLVAILSTGDELVPPTGTPRPGEVRDVNGLALAALVTREGGLPVPLGIVRDDRDLLEARCREGLAAGDCLFLSGGSSVGVRDYALEVLGGLDGARILAHGVAVKPGKPTLLAQVGEKPLVGFPGHPVSALVIFHILGRPLMDRLCGRRHAHRPPPVRARLARNLASAQGREDYVRVTLTEARGELEARPILGGSGLIGTLVRAQGLVRIDPGSEGLYAGDWVDVEVLG